jgi:tagaturonate reductase
MVPVAYLYGIDTVREAVENEDLNLFLINAVNEEIIPTIQLSDGEKREFSESVIERFKNPFIRHELLSISLNSCTKYVTRILPSVLSFIEYEKRLPKRLMFALASLIVFYKGERDGNVIPLKDDRFFLELFKTNWNKVKTGEMSIQDLVESFIKNETHFGYDLRTIEGFTDCVTEYVELILSLGMKEAVKKVL